MQMAQLSKRGSAACAGGMQPADLGEHEGSYRLILEGALWASYGLGMIDV